MATLKSPTNLDQEGPIKERTSRVQPKRSSLLLIDEKPTLVPKRELRLCRRQEQQWRRHPWGSLEKFRQGGGRRGAVAKEKAKKPFLRRRYRCKNEYVLKSHVRTSQDFRGTQRVTNDGGGKEAKSTRGQYNGGK